MRITFESGLTSLHFPSHNNGSFHLTSRFLIFALRQHHFAGIRRATGSAGIAYAVSQGFFASYVQGGAPSQATLACSG